MYHGTIQMEKDGAYHVAAMDQGQQVRLSEDYFIATNKADAAGDCDREAGGGLSGEPDRRGDGRGEGVGGVRAERDVDLHYSVNGGPEQKVSLLKQPGAKNADGIVRRCGWRTSRWCRATW